MFLTNSFGMGGAETHILALAKGLSARGYFVAVMSSGGALERELEKHGILHLYAPLHSRLFHHLIQSASLIAKAIRAYRFDIVHAHARLAAFAAHFSAPRRNLRFVTTAHLDFPMTPLTRLFGFWGEKTLAVSEDIRGYLIREYGLSYDDIALTVNGIDPEAFSKDALLSLNDRTLTEKASGAVGESVSSAHGESEKALRAIKPLHIVHVSRMDKDRAYVAFLLCDIIGALHEQYGVTLTLVGGGALCKKLKKRAEAVASLHPNAIRVVGEAEDVRPYLAEADLFVGVSRAALEAMACGIPTLLSGNTGHLGIFRKALLEEAASTNFCCRTRPKATAATLLADLNDMIAMSEEERARLAAECASTVLNHYSLDKMLTDYEQFYASLRPYRHNRQSETAVLGYHGFGNLGDEAILKYMIASLKRDEPDRAITVLSGERRKTEAKYGVRAISRRAPLAFLWAIMTAKTLYVGGGTLLQSETSHRSLCYYAFFIRFAKLFRKEVVFFANGLEALPEREARLVRRLFKGTAAITLRDRASYERVQSLVSTLPEKKRPTVTLTADSGFLVKPCDKGRLDALLREAFGEKNGKPYFVLAANGCEKDQKRARTIENAVVLAVEKGYMPLFLAMQPTVDKRFLGRLAKNLYKKKGIVASIIAPSAEEAAGVIERAAFLLTARLHPMIFAASGGTPTLVYAPSGKCKTFAACLFGEEAYLDSRHEGDSHALCERLCRLFDALTSVSLAHPFYPNGEVVRDMKALAEQTPLVLERALAKKMAENAARLVRKSEKGAGGKGRRGKIAINREK